MNSAAILALASRTTDKIGPSSEDRVKGNNDMTLKSVHTLLDVLHFADSHTAVIVPELGIRVTYDSLRQQVLAMANALASAGIRRGDRWRSRCQTDCPRL